MHGEMKPQAATIDATSIRHMKTNSNNFDYKYAKNANHQSSAQTGNKRQSKATKNHPEG